MQRYGRIQSPTQARIERLTRTPPIPEAIPVPADNAETRSPYTNKFPTFSPPLYCGFTSITVPDGTAAAVAGSSKWFGLMDLSVDDALGQEGYLWGVTITQCSTEPDATGTNMIWGDLYGNGAALVVGFNLPTQGRGGVWLDAPCSIPGVESSPGTQTDQKGSGYLHWETFPPGTFNMTTGFPYKRIIPRAFSPFVYRYPTGARFQVAVVVRGSQIVNASGVAKTLRGTAEAKLHVGLTKNLSGWSSS